MEKTLPDAAAKYDNMTLDMGKPESISGAGLRAFRHTYMELCRKGGVPAAKNADKSVLEAFELTGFTPLFKFL